jgi:hypothetical protein
MKTRNTYDYVGDVVGLLNDLQQEAKDNEHYHSEVLRLYKAVSDENEQLKNKIDVLEDDNETYHKSLEKLNLYTKRFIPTKCTNEFKDCKTNRYYWLDHEGNFKGCLELLNLLDCENEKIKQQRDFYYARLQKIIKIANGDFE